MKKLLVSLCLGLGLTLGGWSAMAQTAAPAAAPAAEAKADAKADAPAALLLRPLLQLSPAAPADHPTAHREAETAKAHRG